MTEPVDLFDLEEVIGRTMFATQGEFELALQTVRDWGEQEARDLLRALLMESGSLGIDEGRLDSTRRKPDTASLSDGSAGEYWRRLLLFDDERKYVRELRKYDPESNAVPTLPWEGITWTLDLLKDSPRQALQVIDAYLTTHLHLLPDGRLRALEDAAVLIRARYIGLPEHTADRIELIAERPPRDLEVLTYRLYKEMGYKATLTKQTRDGGKDVIATRDEPGRREQLRIECKRVRGPVSVDIVRNLLGVLSDEKVAKGVLVTTSEFSADARAFARRNPRIELVNGAQLVLLLNEHLGVDWPLFIDRLCARPPSNVDGDS